MANALDAGGQHVQQEATHELRTLQPNEAFAWRIGFARATCCAFRAIDSRGEDHFAGIERPDALIANRCLVGVAT